MTILGHERQERTPGVAPAGLQPAE